jgi:hypothetical protein
MSGLFSFVDAKESLGMTTKKSTSRLPVDYESKFNTILWNNLGPEQRQKIGSSPLNVPPGMIQYPILPPYPKIYDPRSPATMPEEEYKNWFFKDADDKIVSVITQPLDQGKCGSDWAFATASMFTDTIRHALMTIFGDKACFFSEIFDPLETCTGDIGVEALIQGLENPGTQQKCKKDDECNSGTCLPSGHCLGLVALETRDRISAYYTVGFAPKLKVDCKESDELTDCFVDCNEIYSEWKKALTTSSKLPRIISSCEGNAIIMPLYMFVASGAPLLSEFPIQDWGCIFGNDSMRKTFCSQEFLKESVTEPEPALIQCDRYGHYTQEDVKNNLPSGINDMEQWMMAEILNNASITIGFAIYPCFFQFFLDNPSGIFTFKFLENAIREGGENSLGGHSCDIIGWGEDRIGDALVPYWIARNSWGEGWGDKGFFLFERGIDSKLREAGLDNYLTDFENEFGTLYYAPAPNPNLYTADDYISVQIGGQNVQLSKRLSKVVRLPPISECESIRLTNQANVKLLKRCECPAGEVKNTENICVRDLSMSYSVKMNGSQMNNYVWWIILIILVSFIGGFIVWRHRKH